jgi:D-lactate dehydrogenase
MNIVFFEVQDWEKDYLQKTFPDATYVQEPLSITNADSYKDAEIISTFIYSIVNCDLIDKLPNLKFVATRSTGYDHIHVQHCNDRKVIVSNVPEYGSHTVAEHTFALILTLTRKMHQSINQAKELNFDHKEIKGTDLFGKTIGIIGLGKIGLEVLKIAKGFGMNVKVNAHSRKEDVAAQYGFEYVELDDLLVTSDVITLHVPFIPETKHTINKDNILKVKKGCYLINTARGGLVETQAIMIGLEQNILAGVGLDVLEEEKELTEEIDILTNPEQKDMDLKTLVMDHILISHPRVVITPHNAFNSQEALMRIEATTIENIQHFIEGKVENVVGEK